MKMIEEAVRNSKVKVKLVEIKLQGKDHASLINMTESLYLKVAYLKVM